MINVAIVEDEQEAVEYLSDCLHRYGEKTGETFSFTHFPEPITFLEKYKPVYDLVFMDIRMPMMDGMQAAGGRYLGAAGFCDQNGRLCHSGL